MEIKKHSVISNILFVFRPVAKAKPRYIVNIIIWMALTVAVPLLSSAVSSFVIALLGNDLSFPIILAAILGVFAVYGVINWLYTYYDTSNGMNYIDMRISYHMTACVRKHMETYLEQSESNDGRQLAQKASLCLSSNRIGLEGAMRNTAAFGANVLGLAAYAAIVGGLNIRILVFLLALCVVNIFVASLATKTYEKLKDSLAREERVRRYVDETVDDVAGGKDIRVFGLSDWLIGKYDAAIRQYRKLLFRYDSMRYLGDVTETALGAARNLVCYLYLISLLKNGTSVAEFVFYLGVIGGFAEWFTKISRMAVEIRGDSLQIDELRAYLELDNIKDEGVIPESGFSDIEIVFDHVTYRYPEAKEPVLKDVSFTMRPGEKLALVGLNGAGKSTLVKLMAGLYFPTEGAIYVNGVDTRSLNTYQFQNHTAAIFQNPFVFSYTVGENVALDEEMDEERVWEALRRAGLYDKIRSLSDGLKTWLGKDIMPEGISLSGGETQKLLLARALYRNPALILLDEPTAALDAIAEQEIYQSYSETLKGKTALFISHRLASTRFCDRIILLETGEIREEGTHEELMRHDGIYAELFSVQSKYYQEAR